MSATMSVPDTIEIGGVPFALLDADGTLAHLTASIAAGDDRCRIVNHLAAHPTVLARRDVQLREILQAADLNVADGKGTVWAARWLSGSDQPSDRVYGPDAMLQTIEAGLPLGWRHAFVGGTDEVLPRLLDELQRRYPTLQIAGAVAPPFRPVTPDAVAEDLAALAGDGEIDVLWVGLGVPKQLQWAHLARPHRPARIIATVGAAFDMHAGAVPQAPAWMQRAGLEWAFRLSQDPRRLAGRYLVGNVQHVAGVVRDRRALRTSRRVLHSTR